MTPVILDLSLDIDGNNLAVVSEDIHLGDYLENLTNEIDISTEVDSSAEYSLYRKLDDEVVYVPLTKKDGKLSYIVEAGFLNGVGIARLAVAITYANGAVRISNEVNCLVGGTMLGKYDTSNIHSGLMLSDSDVDDILKGRAAWEAAV